MTTAILLAAGESTRMGRLKALLDWEGEPLLIYQVRQLLAAPIERLVVVLGHRKEELAPLLPDSRLLEVVINPGYETGKVSSIVAGVRAAPTDRAVLLLGVDQPRPAEITRAVVHEHRRSGAAIVVAGYGGRRGHPVLFSEVHRPELLSISEETEGLRAVLRSHANEVAVVETGNPLALVNLNTPEDYAAACLLSTTSSDRAGNQ
jgi:molybdenum cofactor cytidylyltransferase